MVVILDWNGNRLHSTVYIEHEKKHEVVDLVNSGVIDLVNREMSHSDNP